MYMYTYIAVQPTIVFTGLYIHKISSFKENGWYGLSEVLPKGVIVCPGGHVGCGVMVR